ncbi:MAG: tetratricopeptide repeat protein [Algibacter sp.]
MQKYLSFILLCILTLNIDAQNSVFKQQLDSIQELRRLCNNENLDLEKRVAYAKQAVVLSEKTKVDSVILRSNRNLAWVYFNDIKYYDQNKRLLHKNLKLSYQAKSSLNIAYASSYLGHIHELSRVTKDSAYYYYYNTLTFSKNLESQKKSEFQVNTFINIAALQRDGCDYIGSQNTLIKAIGILQTLSESTKNLESLSIVYSALALNLFNLKEYDKALNYYQKSLEINYNTSMCFIDKIHTKINIAEVYKNTHNYKKVFKIYDELLKDEKLYEKHPNGYATILSNIAYAMFLSGDKNYSKIDSLFTKSHHIFEELKLYYELSASGNDMSEFYAATNQKGKAIFYAEKVYEISKTTREYEEQLRALKQLSKLKKGDTGKAYLYEYIALEDSLVVNERTNRNKFARIQFETDQYIKDTKRLNTQNILTSILAGIIIITLGLFYFIRIQDYKNKVLLFEKEQQEANQGIYSLMLKQQAKLEDVRLHERHRIAEDLHDGILSQLFGARMGIGFLDVKGDDDTIKQHHIFIDELQKIEKEIRDVSHELRQDESFSKSSFESIIDQYIKQQSIRGNFKYNITNTHILFDAISDTIKVNLYRIVQEVIHNIIKYAKVKHVDIHFYLESNNLNVIIKNDGVGFHDQTNKKRIELKNIDSRVKKINGTVKIKFTPNKNTLIYVIIPL